MSMIPARCRLTSWWSASKGAKTTLKAATHTHGAHVSGRKASQLTLTSIPKQYPPATKHRPANDAPAQHNTPAGSHLCLEGRAEQVVVSGNTQLCRIHATAEGRPVLLAVVAVLLVISPCIDGVLQRLFCSCCLRDVILCSLTALEGFTRPSKTTTTWLWSRMKNIRSFHLPRYSKTAACGAMGCERCTLR